MLVEEAAVDAIGVRGDEVDRHADLRGVLDQLGHPGRARRGRAAHFQLRIDLLDVAHGGVEQVKVGFLIGVFPEAAQVRLVPDLEIPAPDFLLAIALLQVTHERGHQRAPLRKHRMGSVALPVENVLIRGPHRLRRKAQFHERADAHREQPVVEPVDAGPVVDRLAVDLAVGAEHVVEDGVETDVAKAQFRPCRLQLREAVVAHQRAGVIGADGEVEEAIQRRGLPLHIDVDVSCPWAAQTTGARQARSMTRLQAAMERRKVGMFMAPVKQTRASDFRQRPLRFSPVAANRAPRAFAAEQTVGTAHAKGPRSLAALCLNFGARSWTRTNDPLINSQVL